MIHKTVSSYKRRVKSWRGTAYLKDETHVERVIRETWWLMFIPFYSRITIKETTI